MRFDNLPLSVCCPLLPRFACGRQEAQVAYYVKHLEGKGFALGHLVLVALKPISRTVVPGKHNIEV